ncbi:MAG TPA: DUF4062 domain-containing protein, partial [Planctomycetaceae bacterium]|nr:DUF4062 domain-containing protein [Planctomycetaceae bacterium]
MTTLFLSCVTSEFKSYREILKQELERHPDVKVEVQERFRAYGDRTLPMLDEYIARCDAVIHIVGDVTGSVASAANRQAILKKYPYDYLHQEFGLTRDVVDSLTYTQWEAWLAVIHNQRGNRCKLYICTPRDGAPRDSTIPSPQRPGATPLAQEEHLGLLRTQGCYAEEPLKFANADRLLVAIVLSLREMLPPIDRPISDLLPPSLGRLFKGRQNKLADLRRLLLSGTLPTTDARRVAIHGMGGLGKT